MHFTNNNNIFIYKFKFNKLKVRVRLIRKSPWCYYDSDLWALSPKVSKKVGRYIYQGNI